MWTSAAAARCQHPPADPAAPPPLEERHRILRGIGRARAVARALGEREVSLGEKWERERAPPGEIWERERESVGLCVRERGGREMGYVEKILSGSISMK